jgi:hypothetical protein
MFWFAELGWLVLVLPSVRLVMAHGSGCGRRSGDGVVDRRE